MEQDLSKCLPPLQHCSRCLSFSGHVELYLHVFKGFQEDAPENLFSLSVINKPPAGSTTEVLWAVIGQAVAQLRTIKL